MLRKALGYTKMGSGASSNVKTIHIDQDSDKFDRPSSSKKKNKKERCTDLELEDVKDELARCKDSFRSAEGRALQAEQTVRELEIQIAELESTNLDLREEIQALQEKLDYMHTQNIVADESNCSQTIHVKDQYIQKLEAETNSVQGEIAKLRSKYKKKLKSVHTQLAETKQESSLKMFELKDEINKLIAENTKLSEHLNRVSPGESHSARREETEIDSRTSIICELSQQVSEQNERINKLEQKITDRDKIIQDLRHSSSSSSLSPRVKSPRKPNYQESNSSGNSIKTSSVTSSSTRDTESNNGARPKSTEKYHSSRQRSSLAVQEEVDSTEQEMRELAREIKRMQRRKKKQRESEKDNRGSSGVSRDSGLGSATSINVDSDGKSKTSSQRQGQERTPSGSLSTLDEREGDGDMKTAVRRRIPSASYLSDSTLKDDDDDDSVLGESDSRIPSNRTRPRGSDIAKVSDVNPYNYHEYDGSNHKVTNRKHGRKNSSAGKKRSNLSKEELCFSGTGDEADMSSIPLSMT